MAGRAWTDEERQYIRGHYLTMTCAEMSRSLPGRTTRAVQHEFANLGLERPQPQVGDKIGRLTIRGIYQEDIGTQMRSMARVECDCGRKKTVRLTAMVQGKTVSCSCWKGEKASERLKVANTTHGLSKHPLYSQYNGMISRCTYDSTIGWDNYGGRGIDVCDQWRGSFQAFYDWAMATGWEPGLTIDRENVNGHYCPENCKWATCKEQANNRRGNRLLTAFGETKTTMQWSEDPRCKTNYIAILNRLDKLGWDVERAITTPTRPLNRIFR